MSPSAAESSRAPLSAAKRILHVIASMHPRDGGPPEALRQLVAQYQAVGDAVEIVTLDDPAEPFLQALPFPVRALGPPPIGYGASRPLLRWLALNVHRFDLVVINGVWLFHCVATWRACLRARVPYVVFTHGALDVFFRKRYPVKHLKKMIYWPLQYRILKDAMAVLFTSEAERDLSAASFRPNQWTSYVIPYGTNRPEGEPEEMAEAFFRAAPGVRSKPFLLFLSRLHPKKGCDLLLQAFAASAAARRPDLQLVIAGPDQVGLQAALQQQARSLGVADRVHWPGMLTGAAKHGAFHAAEAFCLPSHQENFGIAVAEALAMGTPVLISDQVNIWQDVVEDRVGLVEPDTLAGATRLLERWLALPEGERAAMRAGARLSFDARYSLRRTAEAIHGMAAREIVPAPPPRRRRQSREE